MSIIFKWSMFYIKRSYSVSHSLFFTDLTPQRRMLIWQVLFWWLNRVTLKQTNTFFQNRLIYKSYTDICVMKSVFYIKNTEIPTTKSLTNKCPILRDTWTHFFSDRGIYIWIVFVCCGKNPVIGQADALETAVGPQWGTGASDSAQETKQSKKAPPI